MIMAADLKRRGSSGIAQYLRYAWSMQSWPARAPPRLVNLGPVRGVEVSTGMGLGRVIVGPAVICKYGYYR